MDVPLHLRRILDVERKTFHWNVDNKVPIKLKNFLFTTNGLCHLITNRVSIISSKVHTVNKCLKEKYQQLFEIQLTSHPYHFYTLKKVNINWISKFLCNEFHGITKLNHSFALLLTGKQSEISITFSWNFFVHVRESLLLLCDRSSNANILQQSSIPYCVDRQHANNQEN